MDSDIISKCTLEDLGRANLKMYQLKDGFRFGLDSVLLSWFAASFVRGNNTSNIGKVTAKPVSVLELGAGCGACSLLLSGRKTNVSIDAVELMASSYDVLKHNIELNSLQSRMRAFCSDIRNMNDEVKNKQYDIVMFNPPFFNKDNGPATTMKKSVERLNGRFEENGNLDDFVRIAASRVIPTSGYVVMIMKADRLADCLQSFAQNKITPTCLLNVHPFADKQAASILLCGKRGIKTNELKILPPLILNERDTEGNIVTTSKTNSIYNDEHTDCFI